ncbi:MAG: hypothetical protein A2V66_03870 [Ignavibacteria bacterium RBG_13_36_8]|nr:MAG: hypothetical protein A2V66_03870 [Ignavibacteria bacterium RBG_13_36_8]
MKMENTTYSKTYKQINKSLETLKAQIINLMLKKNAERIEKKLPFIGLTEDESLFVETIKAKSDLLLDYLHQLTKRVIIFHKDEVKNITPILN